MTPKIIQTLNKTQKLKFDSENFFGYRGPKLWPEKVNFNWFEYAIKFLSNFKMSTIKFHVWCQNFMPGIGEAWYIFDKIKHGN